MRRTQSTPTSSSSTPIPTTNISTTPSTTNPPPPPSLIHPRSHHDLVEHDLPPPGLFPSTTLPRPTVLLDHHPPPQPLVADQLPLDWPPLTLPLVSPQPYSRLPPPPPPPWRPPPPQPPPPPPPPPSAIPQPHPLLPPLAAMLPSGGGSSSRRSGEAGPSVPRLSARGGGVRKRTLQHACHLCSYRAHQSSDLKRHLATHQDLRPFQCPDCEHSFRQKAHLNAHRLAIHSRLKPHRCDICARTFAARSSLKRHITYVHNKHNAVPPSHQPPTVAATQHFLPPQGPQLEMAPLLPLHPQPPPPPPPQQLPPPQPHHYVSLPPPPPLDELPDASALMRTPSLPLLGARRRQGGSSSERGRGGGGLPRTTSERHITRGRGR